ncbi:ankyrin repeat and LEM domain-containing protein 1 isoform X2 [Antechinus flavipes]|uniref:ankyrin repeat and LEM domain-containing protein 1 isoform X2 n=1 Tax=Antechinus flavipes TaxID=38775 RepID=UPI0022365980|nr:ankyrin repeat and LEM domain-containing protein 1 isoform X2 [Antechinus flavipes]
MAEMGPWTADWTKDSPDCRGSVRLRGATGAAALALARRLREALNAGQAREVESLLMLGADPNLVLPDGVAAVHLAAGSERDSGLQCLAVLLRHGADPNARSEDALTPVHVAASWGCSECLKLLLREGGDPELQDQDGKRALDLAAEHENQACVEILRERAGSQGLLPGPALRREEDQSAGFSAPNGEELDTSIWGLSDVTSSPRPLGSPVRAQLDGPEVGGEAVGAGHALPSQALPAHPQPSKGKGLGVDKLSGSDFRFPAPLFPQPTSSLSPAPALGSLPPLGLEDKPPDHSCLSPPDPPCEDQDETLSSSLPAARDTSSPDSFLTAVEAFEPDGHGPDAVPPTPSGPDTIVAAPSRPRERRSGSQPGSTESRAPQTSGPPRRELLYTALRAELRAMALSAEPSQPTLERLLPARVDPVSQLNARLRGLVLGSPPEPQELVTTGTSYELQGWVSHNGESYRSSFSDQRVKQGPPPKVLPGRGGPGSLNNETPRQGKPPTLGRLEEAGASPLPPQTDHSVAFPGDDPFSEFLTDDKTSQSSEDMDGASVWLTEDGEEEDDRIPRSYRTSSCQNRIGKPPEAPSLTLYPRLLPVGRSPQPSGPEPLRAGSKPGPSFLDQRPPRVEDTDTDRQCGCHPALPFPARGPSTLSNQEQSQQRQALGESPGPGPAFPGQYHLKRLKEGSPGGPAGYSRELTLALQTGCVPNAQDDEDVLAQQFDQPDPTQRWREGTVKSSFTYLLLDPRVTQNLPSQCHILSPAECFQTFIRAIFYVGKGTRTRPYSHLSEALRHRRDRQKQTCPKVERILDIWASGHGVVSLHCFQNVVAVEAYTREACLVDALGTQVLSNQKKGHYYGVAASWPAPRRRRLGVHLLHRALAIFLAEGERQLRPPDIQAGT